MRKDETIRTGVVPVTVERKATTQPSHACGLYPGITEVRGFVLTPWSSRVLLHSPWDKCAQEPAHCFCVTLTIIADRNSKATKTGPDRNNNNNTLREERFRLTVSGASSVWLRMHDNWRV